VPDDAGVDVRVFGMTSRVAQSVLQVANLPAASGCAAAVRAWRPDLAIVPQFTYHLSPSVLARSGAFRRSSTRSTTSSCVRSGRSPPDATLCNERTAQFACGTAYERPALASRSAPLSRHLRRAASGARRYCGRSVQRALAREGVEAHCRCR
jgi:hypothetical protein